MNLHLLTNCYQKMLSGIRLPFFVVVETEYQRHYKHSLKNVGETETPGR